MSEKLHNWLLHKVCDSNPTAGYVLAREAPQLAGTECKRKSTNCSFVANGTRKLDNKWHLSAECKECKENSAIACSGSKNRPFRSMGSRIVVYLLQTLWATWWLWPMALSHLCSCFVFAVTAVCSDCRLGESSRRLQHFGCSLWQFTLAE